MMRHLRCRSLGWWFLCTILACSWTGCGGEVVEGEGEWEGEWEGEGEDPLLEEGPAREVMAFQPTLPACTETAIRARAPASAKTFLDRAFRWVHRRVYYCQCVTAASAPYRADCSGFVSMVWGLGAPGHSTFSLAGGPWSDKASVRIAWSQLTIGDAINDPDKHVFLFAGWRDKAHTKLCAIEEFSTGHPATIRQRERRELVGYLPIRKAGYRPRP